MYENQIAKALADNAVVNRSVEPVADVYQVDAIVVGNSFQITVPTWTGEGEEDEPQVYEVTVRRVS